MKRPSPRRIIAGLFATFVSATLAFPQDQEPADRSTVIRAAVDAVVVDVVVRDRAGRPVRDLKPGEIELLENGVPQEVISFRLVQPDTEAKGDHFRVPGAKPTAPVTDPLQDIRLVTLIFERLGLEGRRLSGRAVGDFLKNELRDNVLISVFALDRRLHILQQFTNDRRMILEAVKQVTSGANTQFISRSTAIQQDLGRISALPEDSLQVILPGDNPASTGSANPVASLHLARLTMGIMRSSQSMEREHQGQTSLFALLPLIREQRGVQGRKTVIYFSEGLMVPPNWVSLFRSTIGEANAANVSFYSVDARGLTTGGLTSSSREMLERTARTSQDQQILGAGSVIAESGGTGPGSTPVMQDRTDQADSGAVTRDQVMIGEDAEVSLRLDAQTTLRELALSTGGALIANTNDLKAGLDKIADDIQGYYELAYLPQNLTYDGRFLPITVRVSRPNVQVQARSGYFALPPVQGSSPVFPYELPLLAALDNQPLPRDFTYRSQALRFARTSEGIQHTLALEIPLSSFSFSTDKEKEVYRTRFALMAMLKDARGQIVEKFSQDYPLEGPLDRLEALQRGNIVFMRNFYVQPGRYTLETVVADHATGKSSARRSVLMVPSVRQPLSISSLTVVRRGDPPTEADREFDNPLVAGNVKIVPNLGDPIPAGPENRLALYLVVYTDPAISEKPQLLLEFSLNGEAVAQAMPELPAPDDQGRIPYIATLPLDTFQPGEYLIRGVVQQGSQIMEERTFVTIAP
jgi:VWFA-related protein